LSVVCATYPLGFLPNATMFLKAREIEEIDHGADCFAGDC